MYPRLAMKFCQRSLYRGLTNIRLQCSTLSHVPKKGMEKQTMDLVSKKFPGYKVIYVFPYIAHASAFNAGKRRITYLTGAVVPLTIGLGLIDVISFNVAGSIITSALLLSVWVHTTAIPCNNLVGLIYVNLEEESVILSYIDFWGKRTNLTTNIDDVIPLSDNRLYLTDPLYKKILFASQKKKLKITLKLGKIMDAENFRCVLGVS